MSDDLLPVKRQQLAALSLPISFDFGGGEAGTHTGTQRKTHVEGGRKVLVVVCNDVVRGMNLEAGRTVSLVLRSEGKVD